MLTPRRLIITDGSLPSLAGLTLQDRPDQVILWVPDLGFRAAPRRLEAIRRQAAHFHIDRIIGPGCIGSSAASEPSAPAGALSDASLLISALLAARNSRCGRIIWPTQAGMDLDRMSRVHEVVMFVSHVSDLDLSSMHLSPEIRTPVLDCTDEQIIDLIGSSGVPISMAWWCDHESPESCGECDSCRRWDSARRSAVPA